MVLDLLFTPYPPCLWVVKALQLIALSLPIPFFAVMLAQALTVFRYSHPFSLDLDKLGKSKTLARASS